jgi:anti-anti-sigma factor
MSTGRTNPLEPQQLETAPSPRQAGTTPADEASVGAFGGLAVAIGRALGTVVVTVHGELDGTTSPQLAEVLRDLIDDQGNLSVVVDARDLTLTAPEGAAAFAVAAQWAHRHGGTLSLAYASEPLRRALHEGGVHEVLRFAD